MDENAMRRMTSEQYETEMRHLLNRCVRGEITVEQYRSMMAELLAGPEPLEDGVSFSAGY